MRLWPMFCPILSLWEAVFPWHCPACRRTCRREIFCECGQLFRSAEPQLRWLSAADERVFPVRSLLEFSPAGRLLWHRIKYQGELQWLRPWLHQVQRSIDFPQPPVNTVLVPVPTRRGSWLHRGFNPAEEIARIFADAFFLQCETKGLDRKWGSAAQVGKNRADRVKGILGQFRVRPRGRTQQNIILVDDVITTGATVKECARILEDSGHKVGGAWSLFRA
jgi:predicted amidophosphoribosyltransferase